MPQNLLRKWCYELSIGERIGSLRKEKGLSQGQLADALSVSRQAVSKWENDQSSPDTLRLVHLADVLDTDVEYLATGAKPVYESPPIIVNLVKKSDIVKPQVIEKPVLRVVEKPVIRKVTRVKYVRNPWEFLLLGCICLLLGFVIGLLF